MKDLQPALHHWLMAAAIILFLFLFMPFFVGLI
jgi:hypothetical protein